MMNADVKRKIDNARNILVGKIPSPKGQIELISLALIYKAMAELDKKAESLGGKAKYFAGEWEKYAWDKLMDSKLDNTQRLLLFREAIEKMDKNPNLPTFFKSVFKDAYLPFNDGQILSLFLKEIDWFTYEHMQDLGDAYEYLLSIWGTQKEAGQFRTPRHIIDFIVEVVNPTKQDKILDPACGTAGFLISAHKFIEEKQKKTGKKFTPEEKQRLSKSFVGYDIDPTMVKIAQINMYLHGFKTPDIREYDTLTRDTYWDEKYNVILANPPFMTPKGGIRPHQKFRVKAKRSEVLFVDYILEHLTANGRAGIIVPEGIIFKSEKAYKALRKWLVEEGLLWAVVSLPAGVFNPYAGVKTSVLLIDKQIARQSDEILFIKIENDGFDLGAQRRPINKNDLPEALEVLKNFKQGKKLTSKPALWVEKKKIAEDEDYNLTADRYRQAVDYTNTKWPMVELGEVLNYEQPTKYIVKSTNYDNKYKIPVLTAGKTFILGYTNEKKGIFPKEKLPVIIFDDFTTAQRLVDFPFKVKSSAMKILLPKNNTIDIRFVFYVMQKIPFQPSRHKRHWISEYSKFRIPFPPLNIQKQIVEEIEEYQKIIDGAKQVIANYKPHIKIDPSWPMVKLREIAQVVRGGSPRPIRDYLTKHEDGINWIKIGDVGEREKYITKTRQKIKKTGIHKTRLVQPGDLILSNSMSFGRPYIVKIHGAIHDGWLLIRINDSKSILVDFLYEILKSNFLKHQYQKLATGGVVKNLNSNLVKEILVPIPPIETQKQVVARIEEEQKLINVNKRLIEIFKQKIREKINEIWEENV